MCVMWSHGRCGGAAAEQRRGPCSPPGLGSGYSSSDWDSPVTLEAKEAESEASTGGPKEAPSWGCVQSSQHTVSPQGTPQVPLSSPGPWGARIRAHRKVHLLTLYYALYFVVYLHFEFLIQQNHVIFKLVHLVCSHTNTVLSKCIHFPTNNSDVSLFIAE